MLVEITRKTGLAQINATLKKLKSGKPFDAKKHCGKVKWDIDGLTYQKDLRNEWD
jgi:capsule polysaccharide modification protein KpsS